MQAEAPSPDAGVTDLLALFRDAGFEGLGKSFTLAQALPALLKLAHLTQNLSPLERYVVREECVHRLTKAKVRTPSRAADMALGFEGTRATR